MRIDVVTIFPEYLAPLDVSLLGKARERGILDVHVHDLRTWTDDVHRTVDDSPYGGGPGMVMKPEPIFRAVEAIAGEGGVPQAIVLVSPHGRQFTQAEAARLSALDRVTILCGRYEGIDDRVREGLATEELSIGDFVVSGGELPALIIIDTVARLIPGVVGDEDSVAGDSFSRGLLDFPHFTRPAEYRDLKVPDVLVSGHHGEIRKWRKRQALELTLDRRPELLADAELDVEEQEILRELMEKKGAAHGRD